ncbi:MAG: hypothetical protein COA49_06030 [Bacteroidetes bacterium]|nr:MAG: hypothetical protein COA49_06030 [Bacteroidota bacterium]
MKNLYLSSHRLITLVFTVILSTLSTLNAQTFSATAGPVSQLGSDAPESGASPLGMGLSMQQNVGRFVSLDLDSWKGDLYEDYGFQGERSQLTSIGAAVRLIPFLSSKTAVRPWIGGGVSWGSNHVKADLLDSQGREYHLWSDGLLYDVEEPASAGTRSNDPGKATQLFRDYEYETSLGAKKGITLPVKLGVDIQLTPAMKSSFSFTANLGSSNIFNNFGSEKAIGGKSMVTTLQAGLGFNISNRSKRTKIKTVLSDSKFSSNMDFDRDGINDIVDRCPGTPAGASVNEKGCATDFDGDGVPDYRDLEIHSLSPYVDVDGISVTHEEWDAMYSTTKASPDSYVLDYAVIVAEFTPEDYKKMLEAAGNTAEKSENRALEKLNEAIENSVLTYRVQYGVFSENMKPEDTHFEVLADNSGLLRYVGPSHDSTISAREELEQNEAEWADDAFITAYRDGRRITMAEAIGLEAHRKFNSPEISKTENVNETPSIETQANTEYKTAFKRDIPVFRVQLGRFSDLIPVDIFEMFMTLGDVEQTIESDGTYRYFTLAYADEAEARQVLEHVKDIGISDAFLTAEVNGSIISILEARELTSNNNE